MKRSYIIVLSASMGTLVVAAVLTAMRAGEASTPLTATTFDTPTQQYNVYFGGSVAMGDMDGDAKADLAIGELQTGRVRLFSSANGVLIRTLENPDGVTAFASTLAAGDVNNDGRADVAARMGSKVHVFSGATGALIHTLQSPNPANQSQFGFALATGDVNGDNRADVAVSDRSEDVNGNSHQGRVYIFSGATGGLLLTLDTPNPEPGASSIFGPQFGWAVAMSDADGDSLADILVTAAWEDVPIAAGSGSSAPSEALVFAGDATLGRASSSAPANALSPCVGTEGKVCQQGRVYLFSGATGALMRVIDTPNPQESAQFGISATMADVNGDGLAEALIGAHLEDVAGNNDQGRAYLYSASPGTLVLTLEAATPQLNATFGSAVVLADTDGNTTPNPVVGAEGEGTVGRVYSFSSSGAVVQTLDHPMPQDPARRIGRQLAAGDANGDGKADVLAGSLYEDVAGNIAQGRAYLFCGCEVDSDGDAFGNSLEAYLVTDTLINCDNGSDPPDWPPDFTNDQTVNVSDVLAMKPVFQTSVPPTSTRYDIARSGTINILDILVLKPSFNSSC